MFLDALSLSLRVFWHLLGKNLKNDEHMEFGPLNNEEFNMMETLQKHLFLLLFQHCHMLKDTSRWTKALVT